jgi:hypothetical protein
MGCDIHTVIERKVGDEWITVDTCLGHHKQWVKQGEYDYSAPVVTGRNYARFAALAGVRGDGPAARGLPDDLSQTARFLADHYGIDGHSHSWMPLEEAASIYLATDFPEPDPESYKASYPIGHYFNTETDDANVSDFRIVFWFDN